MHSLGRSDYHYQHEPIIFGWVKGSHHWEGGTSQTSLWMIDKPHVSKLHPTMKPVELVARSIRNSLPEGSLLLDPFCGSGTTVIAAHQERRIAAGIELDPHYCDVICQRFEEHTGIVPILETTGEPHSFVGKSVSVESG